MHHSYIDKFAYQDSIIHRLDARCKFIAVFFFTAFVVSLPGQCLSILFCFAVGPFAVLVIAGIPLQFVFKHILFVCPFIVVLALTSIFYDRNPMPVNFGPFSFQITAGIMLCVNIVAKFIVSMLALIALVSTTRFSDLLLGLQKLHVPNVLILQLGFLYRYIFILIDQSHHIIRARKARTLRRLPALQELKIGSSMVGSLFIRSLETASNVHIAMQARGFDGTFKSIRTPRIRYADFLFVLCVVVFTLTLFFGLARAFN